MIVFYDSSHFEIEPYRQSLKESNTQYAMEFQDVHHYDGLLALLIEKSHDPHFPKLYLGEHYLGHFSDTASF